MDARQPCRHCGRKFLDIGHHETNCMNAKPKRRPIDPLPGLLNGTPGERYFNEIRNEQRAQGKRKIPTGNREYPPHRRLPSQNRDDEREPSNSIYEEYHARNPWDYRNPADYYKKHDPRSQTQFVLPEEQDTLRAFGDTAATELVGRADSGGREDRGRTVSTAIDWPDMDIPVRDDWDDGTR